MALGWLAAFSEEIAESFSALRAAAARDISADKVFDFLREAGVDVVRSEVREVIGRLKFDAAVKEYINTLTSSARPLQEFIPQTATNLTKTYKYTLSVTAENIESGAVDTRTLSLTTDTILSKASAIEKITNAITDREHGSRLNVIDAEVTFIERRAD